MPPIEDLYHHERTRYWFGVGSPKPKMLRVLEAIIFGGGFVLSAEARIAEFMFSVSVLSNFPSVSINYPSDDNFRSRLRAILGIHTSYTALAVLQALNFLLFWRCMNNNIRRSILVAVGDSLLIILAAVNVSLVRSMQAAAPSEEDIQEAFPGLELDNTSALNLEITRAGRGLYSEVFISIACIDAAIHVTSIAFRHWLLPPVWRYPDRYEPLVQEEKRWKNFFKMDGGDGAQVELIEQQPMEASNDQASLAAHFWEHERRKSRANSGQGAEDAVDEAVHSSKGDKGQKPRVRNGSSPYFAAHVRYWASRTIFFNWVMKPLSGWALVSLVVESIMYHLIRSYEFSCTWYCHLRFAWALLVVLLLVTIITLVHLCIPFDCKLGKKLHIDLIIMLVGVPLSIIGLAAHIYHFVDGETWISSESSQSTMDNSGRYSAEVAIILLSLFLSILWVLFMVLGIFMLVLMKWKNYYWRRLVKKLE